MDQDRKNFIVAQIMSGLKFFDVDGQRYKVVSPSSEIKLLGEHIYQETIQSVKYEDLITRDKAKMLLNTLDIWKPKDDKDFKDLEKYLEDLKVQLYQALYKSETQKDIRKRLKRTSRILEKAIIKKHSLEHATVEYHAFLTQRQFITALCILDQNNQNIYTEKDFWLSDPYVFNNIISKMDAEVIPITDMRDIARTEPWRSAWSMGKENVFGISVKDFNDEQKTLVSFSKMYDNAYESMDCPPDEVFADDDMFDGWMVFQRRQREKERKRQDLDRIAGKNAGNAGEVFLVAENETDVDRIQSLNDAGTRRQLQQKFNYIKSQDTIVKEKDLPDVKMDLRRQAAEQFKNSMRGK
jgi:hypothetical protein